MRYANSLLALPTLALARSFPARQSPPQNVEIVPSKAGNGSATYDTRTTTSGFDDPKVHNVNSTSYDWWYFDARINEGSGNSSLVVMFWIQAPLSILEQAQDLPSITFVEVCGTFENGTMFNYFEFAEQAVITTNGDGTSGDWQGTGAEWIGTEDMSKYDIKLNLSSVGIEGTLGLNSIAPAHVPCGPVTPDQSLEIVPGVGWANSIPDGNAAVDVTIAGTAMKFDGPGYHDKNWGVTTFATALGSWYWGHARLGSYSIAWLDALTHTGESYTSGYVAYEGEIFYAGCGKTTVRPIDANTTYPPTATSGQPGGFNITMDLGEKGIVQAELHDGLLTFVAGTEYTRWIGDIHGTVAGEALSGIAHYEFMNNNF